MASEPTNGGHAKDEKTMTIRVFGDREAAGLAAANLEGHGIECWILTDDGGGMYPNLAMANGVRLLVRASDAQAAEELLKAPSGDASKPPDQNAEHAGAASSSNLHIPIMLGVMIIAILCLLEWGTNKGTTENQNRTDYHYVNGKPDKAWVYHDGRLVEFMEDRNRDGAWDHWVHYDKNGDIVDAEYDDNFDGKPDGTWNYSNGVLVSGERDVDFNGRPDIFYTYLHGMLRHMDVRPNDSKFPTQRWIYRNGVLVKILRDTDSNGDFREAVRYGPFLNPISTNTISSSLPSTFK